MHFDDMIEPIYKRFRKHKVKFNNSGRHTEESAIRAAFAWALKDSVEQFCSKIIISPMELEHTDKDYLKYHEEKRGYEIGQLINNNADVYNLVESDGFMGKEIIKEVFIIRINKEKTGE